VVTGGSEAYEETESESHTKLRRVVPALVDRPDVDDWIGPGFGED
jgi:hypothetical protein